MRRAVEALARALRDGVLVLAALSLATATLAAEPKGWGYELANELMSPWHVGEPLSECSHPNAVELRLWIVQQEKLGRSRAEVETELMAKYGERIRQAPKAEGRGLVAYLAPAGLALVGAAVAALFLRRARGATARARPAEASAAPEDAELGKRLDAELAEFDASHSDS